MNKLKWYIHAMEYYSAVKRNEVPVCVTVWVNLESMLSEEARHRRPHV